MVTHHIGRNLTSGLPTATANNAEKHPNGYASVGAYTYGVTGADVTGWVG
jgi:hypothetical protein